MNRVSKKQTYRFLGLVARFGSALLKPCASASSEWEYLSGFVRAWIDWNTFGQSMHVKFAFSGPRHASVCWCPPSGILFDKLGIDAEHLHSAVDDSLMLCE